MDLDFEAQHFDQKPKRKADFINPPNHLKEKVGDGGLSDEVIEKAQSLLENHKVDFTPLADRYLDNLMKGIEICKNASPSEDPEYLISCMLYPAMQLKANGGMFHYQLVTEIADRLIQFLEVVHEPDIEAIEIVLAYHTTIKAVVSGHMTGDGGSHGDNLKKALNGACMRYFSRRDAS